MKFPERFNGNRQTRTIYNSNRMAIVADLQHDSNRGHTALGR